MLIKREKIRYYEDDPNKGIIVDWKKVFNYYKQLNCPNTVYNPCKIPFERSKYNVLLSERSTGKTTNVLLIGMILYFMYGIILQYIRSNEDMIERQTLNELFKTILEFGYIEKMTDGEFNNLYYYGKKWTLCHMDDQYKIDKKDSQHFMYCLSTDRNERYKSSYNAPTGDFIIYDEFISKRIRANEFVDFCDLLKTIIRDRISPVVVLLANTIDKHHPYFNEFEIYDDVQTMQVGTSDIFTTEKGTKIYVELIKDSKEVKTKKKFNSLFFGFKNSKISSITGDGWAIDTYPHIMPNYKSVMHGIYIEYNNRLLELEVIQYEHLGIMLAVHRASKTYDDSIIYTNDELKDHRYIYHLGDPSFRPVDRFIDRMIRENRILYQDNSCGTMFWNHVGMKGRR